MKQRWWNWYKSGQLRLTNDRICLTYAASIKCHQENCIWLFTSVDYFTDSAADKDVEKHELKNNDGEAEPEVKTTPENEEKEPVIEK